MIRKILTVIFISLPFTGVVLANTLSTTDKILKVTAKPADTIIRGNRFESKIEICSKFQDQISCSIYPQLNNHDFRGTKEDWNFFFNRCMNFGHLNSLHDVTVLSLTLLLMPKFGLVKTIAAEVGISFVGEPLYPEDILEPLIQKSMGMVDYITNDNKEYSEVHIRELNALKSVLKSCSVQLDDAYNHHQATKCLNGCHGNDVQDKKSKLIQRTQESVVWPKLIGN
ncbi:MAG: hypothetical protein MK008_04155 [Bdellovibrionales bacterium]|nr:hypothetical protein [Bdellovibrionales bacterium]